jgi:hypothetical protein
MAPSSISSAVPAAIETPLTEAQLGLWYAQRLDPDNPVYNTGQYLDIAGPLDVEAFRRAVDTAIAEADALAVRIVETADGPRAAADDRSRDGSGSPRGRSRVDAARHGGPDRSDEDSGRGRSPVRPR